MNTPLNRKEQKRQQKERNKRKVESDYCYRLIDRIARYMDRYYLDPIIGFVFPTIGDIFSAIMTVPYLYISLFKIKSVALSLAILYNTLIDVLISLIPFYIGDFLDIFNRSYRKNYKLIVGFLEDDRKIISEINQKARKTVGLIVLVCLLIAGLVYLTLTLIGTTWNLLVGLLS